MKNQNVKLNSFDYDVAYYQLCAEKGVEPTEDGRIKYETAMTELYHAVCLDIDDTVTFRNKVERKLIVDALARLTKRNVVICFITGRGRSSAFEYLKELKTLIMKADPNIRESQFRRWYCVTNNGYMLFSNDFVNDTGFLTRCRPLVSQETKSQYSLLKKELQLKIANLLSEKLGISFATIMKDSSSSIGENSLRFPVDPRFEELITNSLIDEIKDIVNGIASCPLGVNRGVYRKTGKIVIEVSMTTKGSAIDQFEKDLGIPKNKMVRIGDQGDYAGNDYEMINNQCGFSVGKISEKPDACWPVLYFSDPNVDPDVLYGSRATAVLLNMLKIYPTICLETPDEGSYVPRLAVSEKRNIAANKAAYNFYENQLKYAFRYDLENFNGIWNYIDEQTGAFYIHDSEYELLRVKSPNHILFKIYDSCIQSKESYFPRLEFAVRTDTGLLLRGPINYYYGLAFRNDTSKNLNKNFLKQLNHQRVHFLKVCISALSNNSDIELKDSITRRVLLGIMDSVRDYLLIVINYYLQIQVGTKNALYLFTDNPSGKMVSPEDKCLWELFQMAKKNLTNMYNCLFDNIHARFIFDFLAYLKKEIMPIAKKFDSSIDHLPDEFNFKKGCRVWREIDSFYENVVAVDTSINKLLYECEIEGKNVIFYGMRYGGIELPIIAAMLLEMKYSLFKIPFAVGCMCLGASYAQNHSKNFAGDEQLNLINCEKLDKDAYFNILMDDNLVTGKTLQHAMNLMASEDLHPDRVVVVRYPSLNRIKHMFLPNHGAPDTDLFWEYVYGLTSPTPYTKLNHSACYDKVPHNMYLDALGQFNIARAYVVALLYKNGVYSSKGEVAERGV